MVAIVRDRVGFLGLVLVGLAFFAAIVGPLIAPHDPTEIFGDRRLAPPGGTFLLGGDELGRDILSRALHGARVSLFVGVTVVMFAGTIGVALGVLSGYYRGILDAAVMRFMDTLFAFPTLLLALVVVAVLGTAMVNLIAALTIVYIPAFARIARGSTLSVTSEPYVEAARSVGVSDARIIRRYILPNITAPVTVQFTVSLAYAILVEASLSYLGLGVQPPDASWGLMLATGKPFIELSPWLSIVPGLSIMVTVLGFNLVGDALRDAMDPRLRSRE
ncbi:ABC transporter permease [Microbacterium sp.]|uniref:ABC transporter permease n=1 Tax=Microbacterium sp. TaxID=51671 RepID=UPI0031FF3943|nr:ABC transporter permease [Microbacterium sp.]